MRRLIWSAAIILATLTAAILFWEFRSALVLFLVSLAVNAAVVPLADRLVERGLPRVLALFLIYGSGIVLVLLVFVSISGSLLAELERATDRLATTYEQIKSGWPQGSRFQRTIAEYLPPADDLYEAIAGEQGQALAQTVLGFTAGIFELLSDMALILILSIYWGADHQRFERLWLSLLPPEQRARARNIWRSIEGGVGAYIRSEVLQSLIAGVLLGLGFRLMGMPFPTLLALAGAIAWLFPWVGVLLALIPVLLVGTTVHPLLGLLAAFYTIGVFLMLEAVIEPRIFHRRRYSSILVVLMMIALADAFGIIGIVIAPPLAAAIQIFFSSMLRQPAPRPAVPHAEQVADLQQRLIDVRQMVAARGDRMTPEINNVLERLTRLIEESNRSPQAAEVHLEHPPP